jgi:LmbE family N-acetylglucosaminyl deacetylase
MLHPNLVSPTVAAAVIALAIAAAPPARPAAQAPALTTPRPLRVIAFGAHPDDAELKASGVAALWAAAGHKVKFVAMTNGDIGHFESAGGPLAKRRKAEVEQCAKILGIETEVLDIHDGELMPTLENRRTVARLIREWQADIVLGHRPYDYHPDHRYTGVLMDDAAVVVVAPFFVPDTPPTPRNPVFMYYSDGFQDPKPFTPTMVVGIDAVAEKKWQCVAAMPSQFADRDSWQGRTLPNVPADDRGRAAHILDIVKRRNAAVADTYRERLVALYGEDRGRKVVYAEAFQLGQYGRQAAPDELKAMFPQP